MTDNGRIEAGVLLSRETEALLEGLEPLSPDIDRIHALRSLGLSDETLADYVECDTRTIRRWKSREEGDLTPKAGEAIDDLRIVARKFLLASVEPRAISRWLRSRLDTGPDHCRPIDLLKNDPEMVFNMADSVIAAIRKSSSGSNSA